MNEKEMIEEMCKNFKCCVSCEMFNGYMDDNGELKNCSCAEHSDSHCTQCYISTSQAKVLYNADYRKIPEGSVMLTGKETDEQLEDLLIEYDEMGFYPSTTVPNPDEYSREYKKRLIYAIGQRTKEHLKDCIESNKVVEERTRKETAKEILQEVKSLLFPEEGGLLAWLVAIADKYGVEMEE